MTIAEKLTAVAENEQKVYDAGKQAERDEFWNSYQENGKRTIYTYAFGYWKPELFEPKYDLIPQSCSGMFIGFGSSSTELIDLAELLESKGIILDTKNSTETNAMFQNSNISRVGVIDVTSSYQCYTFQMAANLVTIDKLIINSGVGMATAFTRCTNLVNIVFEGEIRATENLIWNTSTKLSHDSLISAINALQPYTGTGTIRIQLGSANLARLSADEKAQILAKGWTYA